MKHYSGDIAINYFEYGFKDGLPVVFIHGFPFNHLMWKPQIDQLPEKIHAITYDIRGHGQSSSGDGQFSLELFVDDLVNLLDYLHIKQAVLCGLSMGGYITLRTAERHPDRIKGLVLCDTKSGTDTNEEKIKRTNSLKAVKELGVKVFADNFVNSVLWKGTLENNPEIVEFVKNMIVGNSTLGICGTLLALASRTDTTDHLSSISVPTCIITGEFDMRTPPSVAENMHNLITGSELHIIKNAGHLSNLENSIDFNKTLISFLNKSV